VGKAARRKPVLVASPAVVKVVKAVRVAWAALAVKASLARAERPSPLAAALACPARLELPARPAASALAVKALLVPTLAAVHPAPEPPEMQAALAPTTVTTRRWRAAAATAACPVPIRNDISRPAAPRWDSCSRSSHDGAVADVFTVGSMKQTRESR
jgi:hypothetical protein